MTVWLYSPDIKWNGHQGVQHNDVTPETQKASVGSIVVFAVIQIPGLWANLLVPEGVTNGQTCRHQDQQHKNLQKQTNKKVINKHPMVWIAFTEASCDQTQSACTGTLTTNDSSYISNVKRYLDAQCKPCSSSTHRFWSSWTSSCRHSSWF